MGQRLAWSTAERAKSTESAPLLVYEITDPAALRRLGPEWNALVEETTGQLFHRHELLTLWLQHFAPDAALRILVAREPGGRLAAVLPLLAQECSVLGAEVQQRVSPADRHLHRCDLFARRPREASRAFMAFLGARTDWDVVRLFNVPNGGAAWHLQTVAQELGLSVGTVTSVRSPYLKLPDSVEALHESLSPGLRSSLNRRRRRLEELGSVTFERVDGPESRDRLLEEGLALELRGWKGREGAAILQSPKACGFYRGLAELAARNGWLSLRGLRLNGRLVAFDFGLVHGSTYASLVTAYDEALACVSPGKLLTLETLGDCVRRGLTEVELLGEPEGTKALWTANARQHHGLVLFRSRLLGETIYARGNPWLPRVMTRVMGWAR